ncbi:MAG: hypothetical protein ABI675_20000 [Chitinophagaceae bacterium]
METFKYGVSRKIIYWGCVFDSLLELKYALSIHKDYEFLHAHIPIFYDPRNFQPTNYIRQNIRRYTPDFIIRHKITCEAFCIEIKPRAFAGNPQLILRKKVVENYILSKKLDWSFKVVYDDEIILTPDQESEFKLCKKLICRSARKLELIKLNKLFDRTMPAFYASIPDTKRIQFVMNGTRPQRTNFRHQDPN